MTAEHRVRVRLPFHLQTLAAAGEEVQLRVAPPVTTAAVLDALEARYPMLRGTVRDQITRARRPRVRFFADGADVSLADPEAELPAPVAAGVEPFLIVGAISGG